MSKIIWQEARETAERALDLLRDKNGKLQFPIQLEPILEAHEITIKYEDILDGVSGYIHKPDKNMPPEIVVNTSESHLRQRFTIAHEIGHYYDRIDYNDTEYTFIDERGTKYDWREFYADEFAGSLLMPEKELTQILQNDYSPERLSTYFKVSVPAVKQRLIRLARTKAIS